ncbi:AMIN domain-containing protein [Cylindrospermopsis curvispora]|uniref:AMIN domain-containing protein n=1 Tax=Cylindrospermopsis curvispora GIHE-G1 TaxID=2666332 RepID=A0A7H0F124_9CYAN|nr:AMIN domain-containing protein [Cylindrospermopsis curvispora]QNP29740.1 AMIN domain-containing protein [Cylindrospermopsis curvispora GIHE-G1]
MNNPISNKTRFLFYMFRLQVLSLFTLLTFNSWMELALANSFPKAILYKWLLHVKSQQIELNLSNKTKADYFYLEQPSRLVIDLPNTQLGNVETQKTYSGRIQKIRLSQFSSQITRMVIEFKPGTVVNMNAMGVHTDHQSKRWILRPVFSDDQTTTKSFPSSSLPSAITNPINHQQPFIMVPPPNRSTFAPSQFLIMPSNSQPTATPKTEPSNQGFQVPVIEFGQPIPFLR